MKKVSGKYTVMVVYGTRPEAIKVAPVIHQLKTSERFNVLVVSTGQHRQMLEQVNTVLGLEPDYSLDIMQENQGLNDTAVKILDQMGQLCEEEQPNAVLVQGDTGTALYSALAAFNHQIPVIHLEAGLRSGNITSPFPEEGNRKLISQISSLHLAPTEGSKNNLLAENFKPNDILVTGNSVIDALLSQKEPSIEGFSHEVQHLLKDTSPIILITAHRRENLGEPMERIGQAIAYLAQKYPEHRFVFPAHMNPKIRGSLLPIFAGIKNIIVLDALPYQEFTALLRASTLVLTDSGGLQEEAPSIGIPVLVLRENTERPEAITAGTVKLVGTRTDNIISETIRLLDDNDAYQKMSVAVNPYGDGYASERIIHALEKFFGLRTDCEEFTIN
ncbi:non-hydrolyzing UDP-N-acetylglucosamine 2-epimerase [Rothia sp. P7208]|uniref:non-hydrolyzing UDP-N-acetylglucosamine 2-epimerase n=1 Tax=Rothia sp. P7208 TaxID=3402660 RepID=UPI003ACFAF7E